MTNLDEFDRLAEIDDLRAALRRAQEGQSKSARKQEQLAAAVKAAAFDAMKSYGPLPTVPKPAPRVKNGKPEVALLHTTDWQGSKTTTSYNVEVMRERILRYMDKVDSITRIQREDHPVDECVILFGGDMGEGLFQFPQQPFEIEMTLFQQFATVARLEVEVVRRALATFDKVTVIQEHGNHGRIGSKRAAVPTEDNFDRMAYELAREILKQDAAGWKRVTWEDSAEDIHPFQIGNYKALLIHGDEVGRNGYASRQTIVRRCDQWASGAIEDEFRDVYCVDPATEALTPEGWRRYDQIGNLPIATLHPESGAFEWQIPARVFTKQHAGDMVHHHGRSMDHFATADHDMWVRTKTSGYRKQPALATPTGSNWKYRCSASGWVGSGAGFWLPPNLASAAVEDIAELLGWYVAEGHADEHQVMIAQSREKKPGYHQRIVALFGRLGYTTVGSQPAYVRVCDTELAAWLREICGHLAPNKHLPHWAKNWPSELLERVFDAACCGDGARPKNRLHENVVYYTTSQQLADDMQEIGLKLGFASTVTGRQPRGFGKLVSHQVCFSRVEERGLAETREAVPYSGLVWCPTVKNGLWFMRRNGRTMVTGNCGHYHTHSEDPLSNGWGAVFWTGSPESDSRYANISVGAGSRPSQRLHYIDADKGSVSAQYRIWLD